MKHLRIAICEDDKTQLKYLQLEVQKFYESNGLTVEVETFESAEELLFQYSSALPFQCLLLDIGLKKMDGMKLAKHIRKEDKELPIIFITGEKDFVFEGYKVGAIRYLLKPYKKEDLAEALSSVAECKKIEQAEEYIGFRYQGEYVKIKKSDILFAKVNEHYLCIKSKDKEYEYKGSMKQLREEWEDSCFVMANRSTLLNLQNVERMTRTECFLSDGSVVKISRGCGKDLNQAFKEYYF